MSLTVGMDPDEALMKIGEGKHGLIVRADVARAGLSSDQWNRRLEHGAWCEMAPQVWRSRGVPATWQLRVRAGLIWLGPNAALFGRTAAAWWGIDARPVDDVEFVVPRRRRAVEGPFIVHTTTEWDTSELLRKDGVRLTNALRSIIDLAGTEPSAKALENVIDEAVRKKLLSLDRLAERVGELGGRGRSGSVMLRSLLLDSGGDSHLERRFLELVRRAHLPRPTCQVIHREGTKTIARVDFLFAGTNVVVEVTGRLGHVSDAERRRDAHRRNALQLAGRVVLEFTTADVLDAKDYVTTTLRSWLPGHVAA
jgi:very-short-patch-repair endonuclease